jgi:cytochrome c-type biogenesis protein CcmH
MNGNARVLLVATIIALPIAAFALYLPGSTPNAPSEPHALWAQRQADENARLSQFITILRAHLASVDPNSVDASQGQAYLAEALAEQAGAITPEALALYQQSLAHAPADASWRALDEQRIAQAQAAAQ